MVKTAKKKNKKASHFHSTLSSSAEKKQGKAKITIIDYNETQFQEREVPKAEDCFCFKDTSSVTWINIDGIHDVDTIEKIGKHFDLHPLVMEDILTIEQRPKMEDLESHILIIFKMFYYDERIEEIKIEQVSLIFFSNCVISFQETQGDVFDPIRERIRSAKGRIRKMGADYLAYALIDAIVDNYFIIMEKIGEKIEGMEEELVTEPTPKTLQTIHNLKRDAIFLRKSVWPLREVISGLQRTDSILIKKSTAIYLRDLYDHTIQVIDTVETVRDMVSGMLDIYLSSISNKMNEVMKVLTIIATIFIPLTFIAGVYGMNFKNMPELDWRWGYPLVWVLIISVALLMLSYFKRRKWL
ncbi:MAG: magnesium/cobalt transporter CorA [Candidatus Omnitrophica bacterium]|nr:magnesium/cobalt transporter CorA [Candidatus Omnitrophota bacterium]